MKKKEAVITGVGIISPLGCSSLSPFWENLINGVSGVGLVTRFDPAPFASKVGAEIKDRSYEDVLTHKEKRLDLSAQYALAAAQQAVEDSGLDLEKCRRPRCGVILGSARGAATLLEEFHSAFLSGGPAKVKPYASPFTTLSSMSAAVARRFGLQGVNFTCSATCASSSHALGLALEKIQLGKADVIVTGGAEACITPFHFAQFGNAGVLASGQGGPAEACKPFDGERDGMVVGEGAGILVVEEKEHALGRGVIPYAQLAGFGASCDALGVTSMPEDGVGIQQAMAFALEDAGLTKEEIHYINAHGTGTVVNDRIETRAIKDFFGDLARRLPVSSTKSMTGHPLGASGGMEAVICALVLRHGTLPPTINYGTPDPQCDLDCVPNAARKVSAGAVLSNAMGFGGLNASVVFKAL